MINETIRGRAQLRDLSPSEGYYEADYLVNPKFRVPPLSYSFVVLAA